VSIVARRAVEELLSRLPTPLALVIAEELAREIAEGVTEGFKVETHVLERRDFTFTGEVELFSLDGRGFLRELVVLTDSPEFDFTLLADGRVLYNDGFKALRFISELFEDLDVFEMDGAHAVRVARVSFLNGLRVVLRSREQVKILRALVLADTFKGG
jgi:hypothetical protein